MVDLFNVAVFFIVLRETVEIALVLSILFSFLRRIFDRESLIYKHLRRKIWIGTLIGALFCIVIGVVIIVIWYTALQDLWEPTENIWEGGFCFIAAILTTIAAIAMINTTKLEYKWKIRLADTLEDKPERQRGICAKLQRRSFLLLPLITVLREGIEIIIYTGGVSLNIPPESIPIPAVTGFTCGVVFGYLFYRGTNVVNVRWFFVTSSIILCLVSAGLLSRAVGYVESYTWDQVIAGLKPWHGSSNHIIDYRMSTSVWWVSWGDIDNSNVNGGWQLFRAIFGWNNQATIRTIVTYIAYWVIVIMTLTYLYWSEKRRAIRKAELGEWQEGDIALAHAEGYVDPNGDIVHNMEQGGDTDEITTAASNIPDKHHSLDYLDNVMTIGLKDHYQYVVASRQL